MSSGANGGIILGVVAAMFLVSMIVVAGAVTGPALIAGVAGASLFGGYLIRSIIESLSSGVALHGPCFLSGFLFGLSVMLGPLYHVVRAFFTTSVVTAFGFLTSAQAWTPLPGPYSCVIEGSE